VYFVVLRWHFLRRRLGTKFASTYTQGANWLRRQCYLGANISAGLKILIKIGLWQHGLFIGMVSVFHRGGREIESRQGMGWLLLKKCTSSWFGAMPW
jgi:hypothetical protein